MIYLDFITLYEEKILFSDILPSVRLPARDLNIKRAEKEK